jgi:hypothetical protein
VGHDPHALACLARSGVVCPEHTPARIEPQDGKVLQDGDKSASAKERGVFDEDVRRSDFADDAGELAPQTASSPGKTGAATCRTDVLAGESAADDIHCAPPSMSVKCSHVIPDWEAAKTSVSLASKQDSARIGINLDSADGAPSKQFSSQDAASCPCK